MAIEQNFATFKAQLRDLVIGQAGLENLDIDSGSEKVAKATPPPRVLFVLLPGEKIVGQKLMAGGGANGVPTPKSLMSREVSFDVHIWGRDRDQVEALINHVANAIHIPIWGSYRLLGGTWWGEDGMVNDLGNYYVVHAQMDIPITRPPQSIVFGTEAKPLVFPNTGEIA